MMKQRVMKRVNKRTEVEAAIMVAPLETVKKSNYYITVILTRLNTGIYLQKTKTKKKRFTIAANI